jgi:hypothetical protein
MLNSSLEEVLKGKPVGESLFHNLKRIEEKAEPLLSRIVETFPEYTIHDIRHSKEVIKNLNLVIPDTLKADLNEYEPVHIFMILEWLTFQNSLKKRILKNLAKMKRGGILKLLMKK